MRKCILVLAAWMVFAGESAWAHRIDEYLQATILSLDANSARGSMRLIPGVAVATSVIAVIDRDGDGKFSPDEKRAYADRVLGDLVFTLNGGEVKAHLDTWSVPVALQLQDGLGEISIGYHVDLPPGAGADRRLILSNHHRNAGSVYLVNVEVPQDTALRIVEQKRNGLQSFYEVDYQQSGPTPAQGNLQTTVRSWLSGLPFASLFQLGMRHIADGTDHLLFLLVLLLPAPLLASSGRWRLPRTVRQSLVHILGIVTAFTVGHSLTLGLAAMNVVHVPGRPVEILIAVSILVSAVHAFRPIFPGREAVIAAIFGLVHGLAFATTLDRLGLSCWDRMAGIVAFNLGIEAMQLLVVAAVLPSLLLMSRTKPYGTLRIAGSLVAGAASLAWIVERVFQVQTPVDAVAGAIAQQGTRCALLLFCLSLVCAFFERSTANRAAAHAGSATPEQI